jgi:SSS family solute:Na+ symporter
VFSPLDFAVFAGYFVLVMALGLLSGRGHNTSVGGYFRGDNRLPWYVIGMSIVAAGVSSEQFVGEMGYAYQIGMPVANWEWLVIPALSILLWIFIPIYLRHRITTMPEYLEQRFGPNTRTLYAYISVASFVLVNYPLALYTGGIALKAMWSDVPQLAAVWALAGITGLYTIYGGLRAVAWTSSLQCVLLMGGGFYLFYATMNYIDWDFAAVVGEGSRASLISPADDPHVPWTALIILGLSTNTWYYATNQYINQRCLAARSDWHARMGVLLAGALQMLLPLATCFPGLAYYVINPNLEDPNTTYAHVVGTVVPEGLRGFVAAAIVGAIMSTISGLVNSTSTIVALDIVDRSAGSKRQDKQLVTAGRWAGVLSLLAGAAIAPLIMRWESMFRYAQDLWAPMAAPIVVVFLCAAFWRRATPQAAQACLWFAILTVPFTLAKGVLMDMGYSMSFIPEQLKNSLVMAGAAMLIAWIMMGLLRGRSPALFEWTATLLASCGVVAIAAWSSTVTALLVVGALLLFAGVPMLKAVMPVSGMWDRSMLLAPPASPWYVSVLFWWLMLLAVFAGLYVIFW